MQNSSEPSAVTNHEAAVKVGRNDLAEIDQQYVTMLSTLNERKCSLNIMLIDSQAQHAA